jgi:signal transduction histidine kinase
MSRALLHQHPIRPYCDTKPGGPGIARSQYRKIVAAPGGRFTVDNQHGKGLTVTISLPTHPERAPC